MNDSIKDEFTILGHNINHIAIKYGAFLILWGLIVSYFSASESITSLIPSIIGIPILVFGCLSIIMPKRQKLFMHIVVIIGILAFLGGIDFLRGITSEGGPFANPWAGSSKLMLLITGGFFTYFCFSSFLVARKNK